ncbi:MAG: hypothetical protein FWD19_00365 [Defluviitaleaceae bacterium]|nr:hypothetical protein [Defluviitaleaceae bacterium]
MNKKKLKQKKDLREAQQIKTAIILLCSVVAAIIVGALIFSAFRDNSDRVFVSGSSQITLREDGTFIAMLPHNAILSGTFDENISENTATVLFTHSGRTDTARLSGQTLTVPSGWLPSCSHTYNPNFNLRR